MVDVTIKSPRFCLFGGGGSGKTTALASLFKLLPKRPTQRVIMVAIDNNSILGIEAGLKHHKIDLKPGQLFIAKISKPKKSPFSVKSKALKEFSKQTKEQGHSTPKQSTLNRGSYDLYDRIMATFVDLQVYDYVTGEESSLGNVGDLEPQDILFVDSMTPLVRGLWQYIKADRITKEIGFYGTVQDEISDFSLNLTSSIDCGLILIAHEERDKELGMLRPCLMAGQALHGSWTSLYSDVIYAHKDQQGKHWWAAKKQKVETVPRSFNEQDKLKDKLVPDFSLYDIF